MASNEITDRDGRPDARQLAASYETCALTTRRSGSNFRWAFWLLPAPKRAAMQALYAFMRTTDDLGDAADRCLSERREQLAAWRGALEATLRGVYASTSSRLPDGALACLPALGDVVVRYRIPSEHLMAVVDGVQSDLDQRQYATFEELLGYCDQVATAVGMASMHIWGFQDGPEAREAARHCGRALQMTNILRDIREDALSGRCYLPREDLHAAGITFEQLESGDVPPTAFELLMARQLDRTAALYAGAGRLRDYLDHDGKAICGMICDVYHSLFRTICDQPLAVLHCRVCLGGMEKAILMGKWLGRGMIDPMRRACSPWSGGR